MSESQSIKASPVSGGTITPLAPTSRGELVDIREDGNDFLPGAWKLEGSRSGVKLWARGEGKPAFLISGLEGSGESSLHLAVPVLRALQGRRMYLLDYSGESHPDFSGLVESLHSLMHPLADPSGDNWLWSQSYGNLLAAFVALRRDILFARHVLVSPFTRLPPWKPTLTPPVLRVTPGFLFRLVIKPIAEWQFGPSHRNFSHPFFASLTRLTPSQLRIRTAWIRGLRFENLFEELFADNRTQRAVWLGDSDRLVTIDEQLAFFGSLCKRSGALFDVIPGSGHVVLPASIIPEARERLFRFLCTPLPQVISDGSPRLLP
jgi:pimeloyl-ACP methyl ester carboxylesterase